MFYGMFICPHVVALPYDRSLPTASTTDMHKEEWKRTLNDSIIVVYQAKVMIHDFGCVAYELRSESRHVFPHDNDMFFA